MRTELLSLKRNCEESDVSGHHLQAKTIITGYYLPGVW